MGGIIPGGGVIKQKNMDDFECKSAQDIIPELEKHRFSILSQNLRSVSKNLNLLEEFTKDVNSIFSIIAGQEVWRMTDCCSYKLSGYQTPVRKVRSNGNGGGVAIWVQNDIEFVLEENMITFLENEYESIVISFKIASKKHVLINLYRPPSSCPIRFLKTLNNQLKLVDAGTDYIILTGDINIDISLQTNNHGLKDSYLQITDKYQLIQKIENPSRVTRTTATVIDHIATNLKGSLVSGTVATEVSDHFGVYLMGYKRNKNTVNKNSETTFKEIISYKQESLDQLKYEINNIHWYAWEKQTNKLAVIELAQNLTDIINSLVTKICVVKISINGKKLSGWSSSALPANKKH